MSYEREDLHRRASDLFLQVCDLEAPERIQRIESACAEDAALLVEVRSLLAAHDHLTRFLAQPVPHLRSDDSAPAAPPQQIGRYRILEVLGRGGMGVVYLAEQDQPRRQVALKVLQPGLAAPEHLRRFEHEAEILGRLQHPGIAQIFEAGSERSADGVQPWFAMELVRGDSLVDHADGRRLSLRERLALFTRICAAVQHAHQHGVVHRDLKPANILVDGSGQPKILDFGIARAAVSDARASSELTARGELLGTLPYMSPEQLGSDSNLVDARTDVYALGVIAYQLVSGRLPHDATGASMVEIARAIRDADPAPLGSLRRELAGDVETIVAKALEKDPQRRYTSAAELAADVERFLRHEPVLARPASTTYQIAKFARRNRILVGGVAATFVALLLGIAGTGWQAVRASEQAELAKSNEGSAKRKEAEATASARRAERITELVQTALAGSDPNQSGVRGYTVAEAMQKALQELDAGASADEPETEASLKELIAQVLAGNSQPEQALRLTLEALELRRQLGQGEHPAVVQGLGRAGSCLRLLGRHEEALGKFQAELELCRKSFPDDGSKLATSLGFNGLCLVELGRTSEALPYCQAALELREKSLIGDDPGWARSHGDLATCLSALGRNEEALTHVEASLEMYLRLFPRQHISVAASLNELAKCLLLVGRVEEALLLHGDALEINQQLLPGDHPLIANNLNNIALCLTTLGRPAEALPKYSASMEMTRRLFPGDHPELALNVANLSRCLLALGRTAEALEQAEAALEMSRRIHRADHPLVSVCLHGYGGCLEALGRREEALAQYEAGLEIDQRLYADGHPNIGRSLNNVAVCLQGLGRSEQALPKFEAALEMRRRFYRGDHFFVAHSLYNLANCLHSLGRSQQALPWSKEALDMYKQVFPGDHPELPAAIAMVGGCLEALGRNTEALPYFQEAFEMVGRMPTSDAVTMVFAHRFATCLRALGRNAEAQPVAEQASGIAERLYPEDHPSRLIVAASLARIRESLAAPAEAAAPAKQD